MLNSVSSTSQEQERTPHLEPFSSTKEKTFKLIFKKFLDKLTFVAMN
jgi:hypothetical protein